MQSKLQLLIPCLLQILQKTVLSNPDKIREILAKREYKKWTLHQKSRLWIGVSLWGFMGTYCFCRDKSVICCFRSFWAHWELPLRRRRRNFWQCPWYLPLWAVWYGYWQWWQKGCGIIRDGCPGTSWGWHLLCSYYCFLSSSFREGWNKRYGCCWPPLDIRFFSPSAVFLGCCRVWRQGRIRPFL